MENISGSQSKSEKFSAVVKSLGLKFPVAEIEAKTGHNKGGISLFLSGKKEPTRSFLIKFCEAFGLDFNELFGETTTDGHLIRQQKAFGEKMKKGVLFVPIAAQAGYSEYYDQQLFLSDLQSVNLPGMPYDGEKFRIFEVSGDSMYPTLEEGMYVIAEKVEEHDYDNIAQYYIHVIVRDSQIVIKRLFPKGDGTFVMISDNDEFYKQQLLQKDEIKELWLVKRKMDWHMPPPKKFEITV